MPKRKQSRKGKSGRSFKKRHKSTPYGYGPAGGNARGRRGTTQSMVRYPNLISDRTFVPIETTYVGILQTGVAGALATSSLKLNSAVNPFGSFSAIQAPGFVNWCGNIHPSMYRAYIVHSVRLKILATAQANNMVLAVTPRYAAATAPTTLGEAASLARSTCKIVSAYDNVVISRYWTVGEIYGQSPQTVAIADSFAALYNADPASLISCDLQVVDPAGANQLTMAVTIAVKQYVEFFGRVHAT